MMWTPLEGGKCAVMMQREADSRDYGGHQGKIRTCLSQQSFSLIQMHQAHGGVT